MSRAGGNLPPGKSASPGNDIVHEQTHSNILHLKPGVYRDNRGYGTG